MKHKAFVMGSLGTVMGLISLTASANIFYLDNTTYANGKPTHLTLNIFDKQGSQLEEVKLGPDRNSGSQVRYNMDAAKFVFSITSDPSNECVVTLTPEPHNTYHVSAGFGGIIIDKDQISSDLPLVCSKS